MFYVMLDLKALDEFLQVSVFGHVPSGRPWGLPSGGFWSESSVSAVALPEWSESLERSTLLWWV